MDMALQDPPKFTISDLAELTRREQIARGENPDSVTLKLKARLEELRTAQGAETFVTHPEPERWRQTGLELRVAALEEELKRLRDRIEEKNG
jgi:hypothetical protein